MTTRRIILLAMAIPVLVACSPIRGDANWAALRERRRPVLPAVPSGERVPKTGRALHTATNDPTLQLYGSYENRARVLGPKVKDKSGGERKQSPTPTSFCSPRQTIALLECSRLHPRPRMSYPQWLHFQRQGRLSG